jgi:DTW domain-containing protein YfiP
MGSRVSLRRAPRRVCYRCFKPQVACVCASITRVANQTGLIILQHPRERLHPLGTARIARLGFTRVRIESYSQWAMHSMSRIEIPAGAALLYPSATARELSAVPLGERPRHLIVLDGTWFHARKIHRAHQWLQQLPHVQIVPDGPSGYGGTRAEPKAQYVATVEAIIYALRILEPETHGLDGLLRSFAAMVARQATFTAAKIPDDVSLET